MRAREFFIIGMTVNFLACDVFADDAGLHDTQSSLTAQAGYWSQTRLQEDRFDIGAVALGWKGNTAYGAYQNARIEAWLRSDNVAEKSVQLEVREAYWKLNTAAVDLRIGRQLIVWGKADGVNPTDNLSVRDYRLLTSDDNEQKSGVMTISGAYYIGETRLQLLWLPEFRHHELPLSKTPALNYREVLPNKEYAQWAARVERAGGEMDWSLSYFDGYDKGPDLHPGQMTLSGMTIDLVHPRIRTLGADAAGTLGRWGWRVEGAYTRSTDSAGKDIFAKNPFFYAVAGVDRTMFDGLNANLQYVYRYIFHYEDPLSAVLPLQGLAKAQALANNQFDQQQHGATLRVHQAWWNDTLTAELSMMMWWQHKDYVFKPKMSYAWSDHLKTTLGADMYRGPQDSFLGNLRKLSLAYVELQWAY